MRIPGDSSPLISPPKPGSDVSLLSDRELTFLFDCIESARFTVSKNRYPYLHIYLIIFIYFYQIHSLQGRLVHRQPNFSRYINMLLVIFNFIISNFIQSSFVQKKKKKIKHPCDFKPRTATIRNILSEYTHRPRIQCLCLPWYHVEVSNFVS